MSDFLRNIVVTLLVILMAVFAFSSGYLANDYMAQRNARTALAEDDFNLYWEVWDKIEANFLGDLPSSQALTYAAIRGSLNALDDPFTVFLEPVVRQEERENLRGNFGGVGLSLMRDEGGNLRLEPSPNNPADLAGVRSGDILLSIDNVAITTEATVAQISELLRGEKGSDVVLTIVHENERVPVDITVVRDDILIPSVVARLLRQDRSIGYIQLTRFSAESGHEVEQAILSLKNDGAERFILDLRNNGGGLLSAAVDVSSQFLNGEVVYHQITRNEGESTESSGIDAASLPDAPLVLLVNQGTASSSEIVAGALQDNQRATLIGEQTYGKGSVQLVYDLSDGSSVHVTWARWLTPQRREIDRNGLAPDIVVTQSAESTNIGRDDILERAIIFLQSGS
ncbi:MAG TPA: S41 family peptidase [Anaerolineae bacterium]|nr:S41 family peptidase [Anaerolineae bacterium]